MAEQLKNSFSNNDKIEQGRVINAHHVSQSVDAFTGAEEYDITIKGTLAIQDSNGNQILKFDGNEFLESDTDQFLVRRSDGVVGFVTGGVDGTQGPPGPQGETGPQGEQGSSGVAGTNGTSGTSGTGGSGGDECLAIDGENGSSGTSGIKGRGGTFQAKARQTNFAFSSPSGNGYFAINPNDSGGVSLYINRTGFTNPTTNSTNLELLLEEIGVGTIITIVQDSNPEYSVVLKRRNTNIGTTASNVTVFGCDILAVGLTSGGAASGYFETDEVCTFYLSVASDVAPGNRSGNAGSSGTSGVNLTKQKYSLTPNPTVEFDDPLVTIERDLSNLFRCQVPYDESTFQKGNIGFEGTNVGNNIDSGRVSKLYVSKYDTNRNYRGDIISTRLGHFFTGVLRLKDTTGSPIDFSYTSVTDEGDFLAFGGVSAPSGQTFGNSNFLETFDTRNGVYTYELEPNEYKRIYVTNDNQFNPIDFCLTGLKEGVSGYSSTGKFKPGQRTTVEFRGSSSPINLQYLALTGGARTGGSNNPYGTDSSDPPIRTDLGIIEVGKRAIVDFIYYESNDGSRYGLMPTGEYLNFE